VRLELLEDQVILAVGSTRSSRGQDKRATAEEEEEER